MISKILGVFKTRLNQDLDNEAAYYLENAIIRFEKEKSVSWSTAHDDDLKTLKRAWRILKVRAHQ